MKPLWPTLLASAVVTAVAVAWGAATLPPWDSGTLLYAIPPFLFGLYLAVSATWMREVGLYASVLGSLPLAVHRGVQLIGCAMVGMGTLLVLLLPSATDREAQVGLSRVKTYCHQDAGERVERDLVRTLDALVRVRDGRAPATQQAIDAQLHAVLNRCLPLVETAFARPQGTHVSWLRLRDWMVSYPRWSPRSPVLTAPYTPLTRTAPKARSVEVEL